MNLFVVSEGRASTADLAQLASAPEFRKATRNIKLAFLAVRQALAGDDNREGLALALGSVYGELDATTEFLVTLKQAGVARPILFQHSLHNATTGFLALQLRITGPTVTLSNREQAWTSCLEAAAILLEAGDAELCVAAEVEGAVARLRGEREHEGARAILVATEAAIRARGLTPLGPLSDFRC